MSIGPTAWLGLPLGRAVLFRAIPCESVLFRLVLSQFQAKPVTPPTTSPRTNTFAAMGHRRGIVAAVEPCNDSESCVRIG